MLLFNIKFIVEGLRKKKKENYKDSDEDKVDESFVDRYMTSILLISAIIWIIALYLTVMTWHKLPTWAQVLTLIGLLTGVGGPIMTIVVVLVVTGGKIK